MKPKLILCFTLVLGGGLISISPGAQETVALFPIIEVRPPGLTDPTPGGFVGTNILGGFIDQTGAVIIPPRTDWFLNLQQEDGHFPEGLEPVQMQWKPGATYGLNWGYLDAKGKFAIAPRFNLATPFAGGLAAVRGMSKQYGCAYGYIDHAGNFVIPPQFQEAGGFSEGMAEAVDTNYLMGFIDRTGKWIIKPQFRAWSRSSSFSEGLACVPTNDITVKYPFDSNTNQKFKWGYVNKKGERVIDFKFDEARAFAEGLAAVTVNNKGGYMDGTGKYVIPPQFDAVWSFSEGLARVEARGQMEFINKRGDVVFTVTNGYSAGDFSDGLANVWLRKAGGDEIWGYMDHTGHFVIKPQFQHAEPFHNGLAWVIINDKPAYINKSGVCVWRGGPPQ